MARPATLTAQMKAFADAYIATANGVKAATEAGYTGTKKVLGETARKLLRKPQVQEYLVEATSAPDIADRDARQRFWTQVMIGKPQFTIVDGELEMAVPCMKDRLRASELLGKSQQDFIERIEVADVDTVFVLPDNGRGDKRAPPRGDDGQPSD